MRGDGVDNKLNLLHQLFKADGGVKHDARNNAHEVPELQILREMEAELRSATLVPTTQTYDPRLLHNSAMTGMRSITVRTVLQDSMHKSLSDRSSLTTGSEGFETKSQSRAGHTTRATRSRSAEYTS